MPEKVWRGKFEDEKKQKTAISRLDFSDFNQGKLLLELGFRVKTLKVSQPVLTAHPTKSTGALS